MIAIEELDAEEYAVSDLIDLLHRMQLELGGDCRIRFDAGHNNISVCFIRVDAANAFTEFYSEDDLASDWKKP